MKVKRAFLTACCRTDGQVPAAEISADVTHHHVSTSIMALVSVLYFPSEQVAGSILRPVFRFVICRQNGIYATVNGMAHVLYVLSAGPFLSFSSSLFLDLVCPQYEIHPAAVFFLILK
jgi:hypothetical protein